MAKKGNKIAIRDVRMALRQKKYGLANSLLTKVTIKKGQEQEAETMRQITMLGTAVDYFKEKKISKCLSFLTHHEQSSKYTAVENKFSILKGLCHFYLRDFKTAIAYFQKVSNLPKFSNFQFYYYLAIIFQKGKDIVDSDLVGSTSLSMNRQYFLKGAICIQQKAYLKAKEYLSNINPESRSETQNKAALLAILDPESSKPANHANIRPLYRAMLDMPLSALEIEFLSEFSELTDRYELSANPISIENIDTLFEKLCERGIPLSESELFICLNAPEEILPTLLYNQLAALYNKSLGVNAERMIALITKHYKHLVQVPEFIHLFKWLVTIDLNPGTDFFEEEGYSENFTAKQIKTIVQEYLKNFKNVFSDEKAEQTGLSISVILYSLKNIENPTKFADFVGPLYRTIPAMRSLSWDCFAHYGSTPFSTPKWSYLDIFSEPLSNSLKRFIRKDFEEMLSMFANAPSVVMDFRIQEVYQMVISQLLDLFNQLLQKQPPNKSDNFPLELWGIFGNNLIKSSDNFSIPQSTLTAFLKGFDEYLDYFEEPKDSIYRAKILALSNEFQVKDLDYMDLLSSLENYEKALDSGIVPTLVMKNAVSTLVSDIDNSHFDIDSEDELENLISMTHLMVTEYKVEEQEALSIIEKLVADYMIMADKYACEHPSQFFYLMLEIMLDCHPKSLFNLKMAAILLGAGKTYILQNKEQRLSDREMLNQFGGKFLQFVKKGQPGSHLYKEFLIDFARSLSKLSADYKMKNLGNTSDLIKNYVTTI